jgi:hypothetical protein
MADSAGPRAAPRTRLRDRQRRRSTGAPATTPHLDLSTHDLPAYRHAPQPSTDPRLLNQSADLPVKSRQRAMSPAMRHICQRWAPPPSLSTVHQRRPARKVSPVPTRPTLHGGDSPGMRVAGDAPACTSTRGVVVVLSRAALRSSEPSPWPKPILISQRGALPARVADRQSDREELV